MRPQKISQGLAPAAGLAKQIEQALLIFGRVFAAGDFELNLAAQRDGVNRLFRIGVGQAKFESQQRRCRIGDNFGSLDLKAQIRHAIPFPPAMFLRPRLTALSNW